MARAALLYIKHLLVAWPAVFILCLLIQGMASRTPLRYLFEIPDSAPYFAGFLIVGGTVGYLMNRKDRTWVALLVFLPPMLIFLWDASADFTSSFGGGLTGVWTEEFSRNCGGSECLGEFIATTPLCAAVAYSIAAWWPWRRDRARGRQRSGKIAATGAYLGHLLVGWVALGALDFVLLLLAAGEMHRAVLGGGEHAIYLGVCAAIGAGLGWALARRDRSRTGGWVFIPPLAFRILLLVLYASGPAHILTLRASHPELYIFAAFFGGNAALASSVAYSIAAIWSYRHLQPRSSPTCVG